MNSLQPDTWLHLTRTVRFGETDAAGVMHFFNLFRWSHESWEESLESYGIASSEIFPGSSNDSKGQYIALPIVQCEANFYAPIRAGNDLNVKLFPRKIDAFSFEIRTDFILKDKRVATSIIRHLAIHSSTRDRCEMPLVINRWIEASSLNSGIRTS